MKKLSLIFAILILITAFTGCTKKITVYSFGPKEDLTKISQTQKDLLQQKLNEAPKIKEGLSYYGYNAKFDDEGSLIVDGFFMNNTGNTAKNITGVITIDCVISKEYTLTIAKGQFEFKEQDFGKLKNGEARPWQLKFKDDLIVNKRDFTTYNINAELKYEKE